MPTEASSSTKSPSSRRFRGRLIIWLLVAVLLWPPLRVGIAGYQTFRTLRQLAIATRAVDTPASLPTLQPWVRQLESNLDDLKRTLAPLMPLLQPLTFVPRYGSLLTKLDDWVAAAAHAATLAERGVSLIQTAQMESRAEVPSDWVQLGPLLAPLADDLGALEAEIAALPLPMGGALGQHLASFHGAVELAAVAAQLGHEWPQLLGERRPATYLLLVQNNHELRATGGFISALAPLTLVEGRLQPVQFVDSYTLYSDQLAYPAAPAAMRLYMDIELLTLRDANWSPHLPTAATVIRTLYQQHTGLAVDGVITVDSDAVKWLLPAFGSLQLPGSTLAITQANVEDALVQLWNNPLDSETMASASGQGDWWAQRKDFMGQVTAAAFVRLQQGAVNPLALAGGLAQALDRRAVQVWLFASEAQAPLVAQGWHGGLQPDADSDFVALVDSNLGYNKANALVTVALDYEVIWPDDPALGAEATLTLTYDHPAERTDPVCKAVSYYGPRYEEMMARCYFNYSRVYVPAGSELLSAEGWLRATVSSGRAEQGTQQFAGYFVLNPGARHQVTLRYRLPATLRPERYRLIVQRQAGTEPLPLRVQSASSTFEGVLVDGTWVWSPAP